MLGMLYCWRRWAQVFDWNGVLEAWYDEHYLRKKSWEQVVGSSFACLLDDHPVYKFDNSEISVKLGVLMLRVGGSPRGWFNEVVKEKKVGAWRQGL